MTDPLDQGLFLVEQLADQWEDTGMGYPEDSTQRLVHSTTAQALRDCARGLRALWGKEEG